MFSWYDTVQLHHDIAWVDAEKSGGIPWGNVELEKIIITCLLHLLFHFVPNNENKVTYFSEMPWTRCDWTAQELFHVPDNAQNVQGIFQVEGS